MKGKVADRSLVWHSAVRLLTIKAYVNQRLKIRLLCVAIISRLSDEKFQ